MKLRLLIDVAVNKLSSDLLYSWTVRYWHAFISGFVDPTIGSQKNNIIFGNGMVAKKRSPKAQSQCECPKLFSFHSVALTLTLLVAVSEALTVVFVFQKKLDFIHPLDLSSTKFRKLDGSVFLTRYNSKCFRSTKSSCKKKTI